MQRNRYPARAIVNVAILISVGLIVGIIIGFLIGKFRYQEDESQQQLEELQGDFDEYRENVREHLIDTVTLLSNIDRNQQKLYRTIASGATKLCENGEDRNQHELTRTIKELAKPESNLAEVVENSEKAQKD